MLIAAKDLGVRLRPELTDSESFQDETVVEEEVASGALEGDSDLLPLYMRLFGSALLRNRCSEQSQSRSRIGI